MKLYLFLLFILLATTGQKGFTQTFSSNSSALIPNRGLGDRTLAQLPNSITVSGISGILDGVNLGLTEVSLNLEANQYQYLEIFLVSPSGRMILLMDGQGVDDITGTFVFQLDPSLWWFRDWNSNSAIHPAYRPDVPLNAMNNNQDPNGIWKLMARSSNWYGSSNYINEWSISFGTNQIAPDEDHNSCSEAQPLLNSTSTGGWNAGNNLKHSSNISELNIFDVCGPDNGYPVTTEWFTFIAKCENDAINIYSFGAPRSTIVQGNCGGPYTRIDCFESHSPGGWYVYNFGTPGFPSLNPGERYYLIMDGQNGITDAYDIRWIPGDCGTQPVGLISFNGNYNPTSSSIDLTWQTSWETDNRGFYIQYRLNPDDDFINAGFIPSASYSEGSKYNFSIPATEEGVYEIQLIQEDIDGAQTEYGPVVIEVEPDVSDPIVIKYQNGQPEAWLRLLKDGRLRYSLCSATGSELSSSSLNGKKGWNVLSLPSDLSSGVYLLRVLSEEFYWSKKLIKE